MASYGPDAKKFAEDLGSEYDTKAFTKFANGSRTLNQNWGPVS